MEQLIIRLVAGGLADAAGGGLDIGSIVGSAASGGVGGGDVLLAPPPVATHGG